MKWLIAFDLDGTLAESKRPLSEDMAAILARLLAITDVAVISGGDWPQFEKQIASRLPAGVALDRLWLMPTTGTKLYRFINGAWLRTAEEYSATLAVAARNRMGSCSQTDHHSARIS